MFEVKRFQRWGLIVLIFLVIPPAFAAEPYEASLGKVEGEVKVRSAQDGLWKPALKHMVLGEKDEILTALDSSAEILLEKKGGVGKVEMGENTRLRLGTLEKRPETGDKKTLLELAIGRVLVLTKKLHGSSEFQVKTPTSSCGVHGTVFEVTVQKKQAPSATS